MSKLLLKQRSLVKRDSKLILTLIKRKMATQQARFSLQQWTFPTFVHIGLLLAFILLICATNNLVEGSLRNVNLVIEPPAVRRGQHAILRCLYDLDGRPLYSAKFYRGHREFYRYTPGEFPNTKVFPFPGIHVDVTGSNATQVLIRNVGFELTGNYSCEVSADKPFFSTATAVGVMQVVELPEKRPQLFTEHTRYEPGDILRANCSTPPSRPRADLKFTLNNMVIHDAEVQYIQTIDHLIASRISMKLQLQGVHFSSVNSHLMPGGGIYNSYTGQMINSLHGNSIGGGGSLILRCTATIGDFYQEYKEIELGTPQKDPVPARVTLSSGSGVTNFFSSYFSHGSKVMPTIPNFLFVMITITSICTISAVIDLVRACFEAISLIFTNAPRISQQRLHSAVAHEHHPRRLFLR